MWEEEKYYVQNIIRYSWDATLGNHLASFPFLKNKIIKINNLDYTIRNLSISNLINVIVEVPKALLLVSKKENDSRHLTKEVQIKDDEKSS
jgi:hypothetical protein